MRQFLTFSRRREARNGQILHRAISCYCKGGATPGGGHEKSAWDLLQALELEKVR
jgi:hypothetical protein